MYERSAIVLERYFDNEIGYSEKYNLRDNFNNYCNLVEKLEKYQINYQKEVAATQDFNKSLKKVKLIQLAQEKLYQRSVKLEYNRNLLFNNIEGKVEDTRRCIEKIESDVDKNNEEMKAKKEELLNALVEYNDKRFELSKCKRYKKMAENDYNEILEISRNNFEGITAEAIEKAKRFVKFDNADEIIESLQDNGKNEKIPFNEGVMENATVFSIDISKKMVASYLVIYDKMNKLLTDINEGVAKVELHKKYVRNEKSKVDLIIAVKEYVVQLLDYERMTVIHGRKSHNRLMSEACENFSADIVQIENLFELLLREIANKATKKAYKELYNKSYLIDIQEKEEKFKKEKNRVNLNTATLINSNYWRIEGIKNIYTIFYKTVSEVFERDVAEFDLPKEIDEDTTEEFELQEETNESVEVVEEKPKVKIPFEINGEDFDFSESFEEEFESNENEDTNYNYHNYDDIIEDVVEEFQIEDEELDFDIFGEKYQEVDFSEVTKNIINDDNNEFEKIKDIEIEDSIFSSSENEDIFFDDIPNVDEIVNVKKAKRKKNDDIEDFDLTNEEKKSNVLVKKLRKINNVKRKNAENDIW